MKEQQELKAKRAAMMEGQEAPSDIMHSAIAHTTADPHSVVASAPKTAEEIAIEQREKDKQINTNSNPLSQIKNFLLRPELFGSNQKKGDEVPQQQFQIN